MGSKVFGAAFHGKLAKLLKYLEAEDDTLLDCPSVDWADAGGMTALHGACQEGHAECVELLLRAGAVADRASAQILWLVRQGALGPTPPSARLCTFTSAPRRTPTEQEQGSTR